MTAPEPRPPEMRIDLREEADPMIDTAEEPQELEDALDELEYSVAMYIHPDAPVREAARAALVALFDRQREEIEWLRDDDPANDTLLGEWEHSDEANREAHYEQKARSETAHESIVTELRDTIVREKVDDIVAKLRRLSQSDTGSQP